MKLITLLAVCTLLLSGCQVVLVPVPVPLAHAPTQAHLPTPTPVAGTGGEMVDLSGIPYTVQAKNSVSVVQVRSHPAIFGGTLMLDGELRNDGAEDVPYNIIKLRVYDASGALLDVGGGGAMEVVPGETIAFIASADVPYKSVARYVIEIE